MSGPKELSTRLHGVPLEQLVAWIEHFGGGDPRGLEGRKAELMRRQIIAQERAANAQVKAARIMLAAVIISTFSTLAAIATAVAAWPRI